MLVWSVGTDDREADVQDYDRTGVPVYLARSRVLRRLGDRPACRSRGRSDACSGGPVGPGPGWARRPTLDGPGGSARTGT